MVVAWIHHSKETLIPLLLVNPLNDDNWNMVVKGLLLWGWIRRVNQITSFKLYRHILVVDGIEYRQVLLIIEVQINSRTWLHILWFHSNGKSPLNQVDLINCYLAILDQSYEIKLPLRTIWGFEILYLFSVEN